MHPAYTFTNPRSQATDLFNQKRIEGCLARAWAELTGKSSHLESFRSMFMPNFPTENSWACAIFLPGRWSAPWGGSATSTVSFAH